MGFQSLYRNRRYEFKNLLAECYSVNCSEFEKIYHSRLSKYVVQACYQYDLSIFGTIDSFQK